MGINLLFLPEVVNCKIMSNTDYPRYELAIVFIFSLLQGANDLDKSILENILRKLLVFYNEDNVGVNFILVPVDQNFNTLLISL